MYLKWATMRKHAKYFELCGNGVMRVARLQVARPALCRYRASRTAIGFAPAQSYAKVFHSVTLRLWTGADNLSRLSRLRLKKSGQRKPNRYAVPRLSRLVPTIFNVYQMKKEAARRVWCAGRELIRATKRVCNATVRGSSPVVPIAGN